MEGRQNNRKSLWESRAVLLHPVLHLLFLCCDCMPTLLPKHLSAGFPLGHLRSTHPSCALPAGAAPARAHGLCASVTKHVPSVC